MNPQAEHLIDHTLNALIRMRADEVIAAEEAVSALRSLPISDPPVLQSRLRQLRTAALRSAELWHMYSANAGGSGYTNDGLSMGPAIPSELSLSI
jgi:hypothetical protein